jgi:glyoxylase-like metal-dependent hydrolase (beta-lactamase superfamily II)
MALYQTWPATNGVSVTRVLGGRCGSFLVSQGDRRLLVDTGTPRDRRRLAARLESLGVDRVDWLVLTHTHYDHSGNARFVRERFGARVVVHREEAEYLSRGLTDGEGVVPRGTNPPLRFVTDRLEGAITRALSFEPCAADLVVDGSHDFAGEGLRLRLVHTPGHSIGSISVIAGDSVAIVGDAAFGVYPGSAFPPFAWNPERLVDSWAILLGTGCDLFIPAHGRPVARALVEREWVKRRKVITGVREDIYG